MHFNGKITHSVLSYLENQCVDLEGIYELTPLPSEFLRDPNHWFDADQVEAFLELIRSKVIDLCPSENFMEKVGHDSFSTNSWGVLNSVLKMILHPQDIFTRPQNILSYFISPSPSFEVLEEKPSEITLAFSLPKEKYPNTLEYLKAALESLPTFMGRPMATVNWSSAHLNICWSSQQESLLAEAEDTKSVKPELMKNLVATIEDAQRNVDQKTEQLNLKDQEIQNLKSQILRMSQSHLEAFEASLSVTENKERLNQLVEPSLFKLVNVYNQFMKLSDYVTRSQQLVILLSGLSEEGNSKQVKDLKKRLNWERLRQNFTGVVQDGVDNLESIKKSLQQFRLDKLPNLLEPLAENQKSLVNLDEVVENSISKFTSQSSEKDFNIDRMLFFDRPVFIKPQEVESLLCFIFNQVSASFTDHLRVVTRSHGKFAEIEIVRKGKGSPDINKIKDNVNIQNIIKDHNGHMKFFSTSQKGATVIIDLPI